MSIINRVNNNKIKISRQQEIIDNKQTRKVIKRKLTIKNKII